MNFKRIAVSLLFLCLSIPVFAQKQVKPATTPGILYFSLAGEKGGKKINIVRESGRTVSKDSLKMANQVTAYYKMGQKTINVKDIAYDNYFLSTKMEPTILQDMQGLTFDASIWISCVDSLAKKEQIVFQVREITLEDGTKIQNPKLAKETKASYKVETNPNFPPGGWESKSKQWIGLWKDWFRIKDSNFYTLDESTLLLYTSGFVISVK